jgi:serine/threonine protein kinase
VPRDNDVETSVERVDPLVGTIFDKRFHVDERIATGGFGAIYRATHVKSGHRVALKVLLPSLAQDLGVVARFRREGDTLTALRSQHTINAYELGQAADRTLFIVMELLYGESLFERYKSNGPFEWKRMVKIGREVCESLEEAHDKGVVHRDLKPTNIHLEKHDNDIDYVKVLDFGIAKIIGGNAFQADDLTNAGQMIGTLDYMSPEQMVGGTVTGQSDIYTLGIVMYEMIAGCTPFPEAMTAAQALAAVMKTKPDPLYLRAPVPEELDRIVMRCLERDIAKRYQTVTELRLDLARLLAGVSPDRSHVIETKPIIKADEPTQFTPPPERLINELRKSADYEQTQFTPPPAGLLDDLRTPPRDFKEWDDDDEHVATTSRRPKSRPESVSEEHERVTKVARLSDIAAAHASAENEQVTKVARVSDLIAADARGDDNERVTSVARGSEAAHRLPPRGSASDRAMTLPRDAQERAVTVPRNASATRGDDELRDRDMTLPRRRPPSRDDDSPVDAATAPRRRPPSRDDDSMSEVATPPRARKPETMPPPVPAAARKAVSAPPRSAPAKTAPPPLPGMSPAPLGARSSAKTAPPPNTVMPPRTLTPQNPAAPRTLTPQSSAPPRMPTPQGLAMPRTQTPHDPPRSLSRQSSTPVPQVVAAPFSPKQPTPAASAMPSLPTPPGISPFAQTELAMPHYGQGAAQPSYSATPAYSEQPSYSEPSYSQPSYSQSYPPSPYQQQQPAWNPQASSPAQQPYAQPYQQPPQYPSPHDMQPGHIPSPHGMPYAQQPFRPGGAPPVVQHPFGAPQRSTRSFDMGKIAAREATIRKLVWIIVLVVGTVVGIILATQL